MRKMGNKFFRKANSFILAAAVAVSLMPVQTLSAAGQEDAANPFVLQQAGGARASALDVSEITAKEYTVIKGNAPVLPKKANVTLENGTMAAAEIQWADWDKSLADGKHTVTGTAGGTQITVTVNVLPCDEEVADAAATGSTDGVTEAVHPLRGYRGLFVAEYDIVPDEVKSTHDRAVIYLPEKTNDGLAFDSGNCWDNGARLQFKHGYNDVTYFQTQNGDGQDKNSAVYYPTNEDLDNALANNRPIPTLPFDEIHPYRVRVVMDTLTNTTKGNYKVFITDPEGIEHEITIPGGNGFRIYPKDGIIKNFAAVRGSYRLVNHKISWISGYATKKQEVYFKAQDAADYVKESEDIVTKELPGTMSGQADAEIVKDGQKYTLDAEKSGWYNGGEKVASVTAKEGDTVTYRAYYAYAKPADKTSLNEKIQKAESLLAEDYTSGSFGILKDALDKAKEVNASAAASQEDVGEAEQALDTAEENLVGIKNLKAAVDKLKEELAEKEDHKADYTNWDEAERVLKDAEALLSEANATKTQVEAAEKSLQITLAVKEETVVKVKSIGRAAKDYKIAAGRKLDLKKVFTVLPKNADNRKLAYSVDKKSGKYATIKSGVVTVKKNGAGKTITVKAAATDGSGKTQTVKIKIMKDAVTKITVKKKSLTVKAGEKVTIKPTVKADGKNANKALAYTSSNEKLATVKNGVVTTKKGKTGKVTITASATDGTGKNVKIRITIKK